MEDCILDKQRIIQATSDILWAIQLTRNILKDDE